jgi:hypothetical protein
VLGGFFFRKITINKFIQASEHCASSGICLSPGLYSKVFKVERISTKLEYSGCIQSFESYFLPKTADQG